MILRREGREKTLNETYVKGLFGLDGKRAVVTGASSGIGRGGLTGEFRGRGGAARQESGRVKGDRKTGEGGRRSQRMPTTAKPLSLYQIKS